ncbi:hypothetical protein OK016_04150 [Vibrio chagasii]|nr:hypothetical protein [Vibrio chagasii]
MMFANPCEEYEVNPIVARAMDKIFTHADHEQNASTSTVRHILVHLVLTRLRVCPQLVSRHLLGPAHGGANEACLRMLEDR